MFEFFRKRTEKEWAKGLAKAEANFSEALYSETIESAKIVVDTLESNRKGEDAGLSWAYFLWGRAEIELGNYSVAYEKLGRSVKLGNKVKSEEFINKRMSISFAIAELLFKMKEYKRAKDLFSHFESSISQQPTPGELHMRVYLYLAQIFEQLRDYEGSISFFEKYLTVTARLKGKEESNYHEVSQYKDRLAVSLEAKRKGFPEILIPIKYENGGAALISCQYAAYLVSELPNPTQASLDEILGNPESIRIVKQSIVDGKVEEGVIFEENDKKKISKIISEIKINESESIGHLMGNGSYFLIIKNLDGEEAEIEFLSERLIRLSKYWKDDAVLESPHFINQWLSQRGVVLSPIN